jgi:hypothetical protein
MRREDFEHVIAAAANVTGEDEFVVIGSQAVLGRIDDPPAALLASMEVDLYPAASPDKADLIDGALGDGSPFHRQFGYFAHGVGPETAKAPAGWHTRLEPVHIPPRVASSRQPVAHCMEMHDLVLAKCAAGRERDWEYADAAMAGGLVALDRLTDLIPTMPVAPATQRLIAARLQALSGQSLRRPAAEG